MLDVLAERVGDAQAPLNRGKLVMRVPLEADEEQARVELAGLRVDPVDLPLCTCNPTDFSGIDGLDVIAVPVPD